MKLSEIIIEYRNKMNISQREFSRKCDLSNSYISFLEREINPKTGRPMIPTIEQYKKLADGMGMSVHHLFQLLDDDAPVDLRNYDSSDTESKSPDYPVIRNPEIRLLAKKLDMLPKEQREQALDVFNAMYHRFFDNLEDENK